MIILLVVTGLILLLSTIFLSILVYKLSKSIFVLEDQIEESLDIIDECYRRISEASKIPVLYDEPVIKSVLNDMATSRDALLLIANKITVFSNSDKNAT